MKSDETNLIDSKKPSRRKYLLAAIGLLLFVVISAVLLIKQKPEPNPASEAIIRQAAAAQLNKDPNDLTNEDFAKIKEFQLSGSIKFEGEWGLPIESSIKSSGEIQTVLTERIPAVYTKELSNITLLENFTNLEKLTLETIGFPEKEIPAWMKVLAKIGIFDIEERSTIDLSPLEKLHNLQYLNLSRSKVSDLEPLKNLKNLKKLYIEGCENITDEQVEELQKALPELDIRR